MSEEVPQPSFPGMHSHTALRSISRLLRFRRKPNDSVSEPVPPSVTEVSSEEVSEPEGAAYQFLTGLVSEEALLAQEQAIQSEITRAPILAGLDHLSKAGLKNTEAANLAYRQRDSEESRALDVEYKRLTEERNKFSEQDRNRYRQLADSLYRVQKFANVTVGAETEVGQQLLTLIETADPIQPNVSGKAPFAQHAKNNDTVWQMVGDETVRQYLDDRIFLSNEIHRTGTKLGSITLKAKKEKPFEVPLDLVVGVAGFDSWLGRDVQYDKDWHSKYGSGRMKSLEVIKHYAGMESEVPPVDTIRALVQPNGRILCDNGEGDSHRIAAAILQGKSAIQAENLQFMRLQQNIIE